MKRTVVLVEVLFCGWELELWLQIEWIIKMEIILSTTHSDGRRVGEELHLKHLVSHLAYLVRRFYYYHLTLNHWTYETMCLDVVFNLKSPHNPRVWPERARGLRWWLALWFSLFLRSRHQNDYLDMSLSRCIIRYYLPDPLVGFTEVIQISLLLKMTQLQEQFFSLAVKMLTC